MSKVIVGLPFEITESLFSSDFSSSSIGDVGVSSSADSDEVEGRSVLFVLKKVPNFDTFDITSCSPLD